MTLSIASTVKLNSGHTIPLLGFGVFQSAHCLESVKHAIAAGYRHIDSARFYRNEDAVGQAVRDSGIAREEFFLTSKVQGAEHSESKTPKAIEKSITSLGLSKSWDLYLLHDPTAGPERRLEAWKALEVAHKAGKFATIGVSNFGVRHLEEFKKAGVTTPAINQIEVHPWCQQRKIVDYCKNEGIVVQAYCPLVRGEKMNDSTLQAIAKDVGKTPAQILIRWSLQKGYVPLPKSDTPHRIKENAQVFDFDLTETQMKTLDDLDEGSSGAISWNPVNSP